MLQFSFGLSDLGFLKTTFLCHLSAGHLPMYQWAYIFLSLSLADDVLVETFLVVLHISLQIQVKWTLVFPTP